jgi:dCMP deaminase
MGGEINKRPDWDEYFLNIAKEVSKRATCIRRRFGAVIVKDNEQISSGYCGAPRGTPNCSDLKKCFRKEYNIPSGKNYNLCRSVHAEMNAIIQAGKKNTKGAVMYLHGEDAETGKVIDGKPCVWCRRLIINAEIKTVITRTPEGYKKYEVKDWVAEQNNDPYVDQKNELDKNSKTY